MSKQAYQSTKPMPEQLAYANLLFIGAWAGIVLMIITYFIYAGGFLSPHVDSALITQNWDKGVNEYLEITNSPHGWGWLNLLNRGDFLNFIGVVLLAVLTLICYLFLIVGYKKRKDWAYFIIAVLEVAVLALAASGILGAGGH
jgi:disulfide bond formation protein DsbB